MNVVGFIPGRMAATRFPGKPLARIAGIPMIGHVYLRSRMSRSLSDLYVATCDREIAEYIEKIGGKVVMTKDSHKRASDRCAEALEKVEKKTKKKIDVAVMIQGDEPMTFPQMIDEAVAPFKKDSSVQVVNLTSPIRSRQEQDDPNEIKIVFDHRGNALYFSRSPIPSWAKASQPVPMWKQVCIIPFRRDFLYQFNRLRPTALEIAESIDMLRLLEHGYPVRMVKTRYETYSVDTREDLLEVEKHLKKDALFKKYSRIAQEGVCL